MKRILKIACLYLGFAQTVVALAIPVPAFAEGLIDKAKAFFVGPKKDAKFCSFIAHIHMLQQQQLKKQYDLLNIAVVSGANKPANSGGEKKLTQTEAYLKIYQAEVESAFGGGWAASNKLKEYKDLIEKVIEQEKELANTHYFFYHACRKELTILYDFIKLLNSYMYVVFPRIDFTCMRFKPTLMLPYKNVNEYLNANPFINDCAEPTRSQMLSVNLALFGSHEWTGECTFHYFFSDHSCGGNTIKERLEPIFSHYGFNSKYLDELANLTSYLVSAGGNLFQICIPHDMVDDLVYLSQPCGPAYHNVILKDYYDHEKNRHTCIRPLIEHMRTSPEAIGDLNYWQARLMFFDPMMDMHPAIKVFRYNTVTEKNMALYQEKLKDIVIRLVCDYLKKVATHEVPLVKLYKSMAAHTAHDILKVA